MLGIMDNDYVPEGADNSLAPWNQKGPEYRERSVFVVSTMDKYDDVIVEEAELAEDGFTSQHYTVKELLNILIKLEQDLIDGKLVRKVNGRYKKKTRDDIDDASNVIKEAKSWEYEEIKVDYDS